MYEKKCCAKNCGKTRPEYVLYKFPNPIKEPDRFRTWLLNIGGDILSLSNEAILKNRRVCQHHFLRQYIITTNRYNRLAYNSVPTLHLAGLIAAREPQMDVTNQSQHRAQVHPNYPSNSIGSKTVRTYNNCSKGKRQKLEPRAVCGLLEESGGKPGPTLKISDLWNLNSLQDETDDEQRHLQHTSASDSAAVLNNDADEDVKPTVHSKETPQKTIRYEDAGTSAQSSVHVHNKGTKSVKTLKTYSKGKRQKLSPRAVCEKPGLSSKNSDLWNTDSSQDETVDEQQHLLQHTRALDSAAVLSGGADEDVKPSVHSSDVEARTDEEEVLSRSAAVQLQHPVHHTSALDSAAVLSGDADEDVKPSVHSSDVEGRTDEEGVLSRSAAAEQQHLVQHASASDSAAALTYVDEDVKPTVHSSDVEGRTDEEEVLPPSAAAEQQHLVQHASASDSAAALTYDADEDVKPTHSDEERWSSSEEEVLSRIAVAERKPVSSPASTSRGRKRRSCRSPTMEEFRRVLCDLGSEAEDEEDEDHSQPETTGAQVQSEDSERDERDRDVGANELTEVVNRKYRWSKDFSSFTGRRETYLRNPGPTIDVSQDPADIFLQIWDEPIISIIASETNRHAQKIIKELARAGRNPGELRFWEPVTADMLYRYFAVLILMSVSQRLKRTEYWEKGLLEMPLFRRLMTRTSFKLLTMYLHFVNNDELEGLAGNDRKIAKVAPILDHCNEKFASLYVPLQHLSLDESLLLWKCRLTGKYTKTKAASIGIKSFDLCEAQSGYLLQCRLYTGKDTASNVVLQLMEGYLDVGHVLVMENWYNQLSLTRFLKSRRTDALGTMSRERVNVPRAIKDLEPKKMKRGEMVARHCGDISLVAWKELTRIVTVMSSYHSHDMAVKPQRKPISVVEYNRYGKGVDFKDQQLLAYHFDMKKGKWYMRVFNKLLNSSLLNAYVMYCKNPVYRVYTHREFRMKLAEGLIARFPRVNVSLTMPPSPPHTVIDRLQPGDHFPVLMGMMNLKPGDSRHKRARCERCISGTKRLRKQVITKCGLCNVGLCLGQCWDDYHKRYDLSREYTTLTEPRSFAGM